MGRHHKKHKKPRSNKRYVYVDRQFKIHRHRKRGGAFDLGVLDPRTWFRVREEYPPALKKFMAQYGEYMVVSAMVCRAPIAGAVNTMLKVLSAGQIQKNQKLLNIDAIFHLQLKFAIRPFTDPLATPVWYAIEKNDVIQVQKTQPVPDQPRMECLNVAPHTRFTFNAMMQNTLNLMGSKRFFLYDSQTSNCQHFVAGICEANQLISNHHQSRFIFQPADQLQKESYLFSDPVKRNAITTYAAFMRNVIWTATGQ